MGITKKHLIQFRKFFFYFSLAIILPLSLFGYFALNNSYGSLKETRETETEVCSDSASAIIQRVENVAYSLTIQPLTYDFLANGINQSIYDQFLASTYLGQVRETEGMIQSICLRSNSTGKVMVTGIGVISRDQLDNPFINDIDLESDIKRWYSQRNSRDWGTNGNSPITVSTFVTRAPISNFRNPGYVIIDLDLNSVEKALFPAGEGSKGYLADESGIRITGTGSPEEADILPPDYFRFLVNGSEFFYLDDEIPTNQWVLRLIFSRDSITEEMRGPVLSFALTFLISIVIIVLLSAFMSALSVRQADKIDLLLDQNSHIREEIEKNRPLLEEQFLSKILYNTYSDWKDLIPEMTYLGIAFENRYFLPLVMRIIPGEKNQSDFERAAKITQTAKTITARELSPHIPVSSAVTVGKYRFAFILNPSEITFDAPFKEKMLGVCGRIGDLMNEQADVITLFSFGQPVPKLHSLYESFLLARDKIQYNLNVGNNIYFPNQRERETSYPVVTAKQIIAALEKGDRKKIDRETHLLFKESEKNRDFQTLHDRVIYLLYTVASHFIEEGLNIPPELMRWESWFKEKRTPGELEEAVTRFFHSILEELSLIPAININDYTLKAIEYIKDNFHEDISLDQIASHVSLHPNYLSRIFKEYAGRTVLEYLTDLRMEKARELLKGTTDSIGSISARLGYNDPRSFIRYFKKYEGVTPGKFRER